MSNENEIEKCNKKIKTSELMWYNKLKSTGKQTYKN